MGKSLRIGVVAREVGLSVDTIRFYERAGILRSPRRSATGYRLFDEEDVQELIFISKAHALGFTLSEVKALLHSGRKKDLDCTNVRKMLQNRRQQIHLRIRTLSQLQDELRALWNSCDKASLDAGRNRRASCHVSASVITEVFSKIL